MHELEAQNANPYAAPGVYTINLPPATWHDADFWLEGVVPASDLIHAARLATLHPAAGRLLIGGIIVILALLLTGLVACGAYEDAFLVSFQIVTGAAVLAVIGYFYARQARNSRAATEPQRVAVNADGIHTTTECENILQRWNAFTKFRASDRVVLLFFNDNPRMARVFSRALFRFDSEWFRFLDYVASKLPEG